MATILLASKNDVVRFTPVSGNIDSNIILNHIDEAQQIEIQQLIGTDLLTRLEDDVQGSSLSGDYLTLVDEYIKPTLAYLSFLYFLDFAHITVGNKGVFKHTSENASVVSDKELSQIKESARKRANFWSTRTTDYLENNSTLFPEYLSNTNEDMNPNRKAHRFGGWQI